MIESRSYDRKARAAQMARIEVREANAEIADAMADPYIERYSDGSPVNDSRTIAMILSVAK
jgi:hypothetical protein